MSSAKPQSWRRGTSILQISRMYIDVIIYISISYPSIWSKSPVLVPIWSICTYWILLTVQVLPSNFLIRSRISVRKPIPSLVAMRWGEGAPGRPVWECLGHVQINLRKMVTVCLWGISVHCALVMFLHWSSCLSLLLMSSEKPSNNSEVNRLNRLEHISVLYIYILYVRMYDYVCMYENTWKYTVFRHRPHVTI
jgi:hypothetical protein